VENTRRIVYKGRVIDIPNSFNQFIELLVKMFPEEERSINAFFSEAKNAYEECYKEVSLYGSPLPAELIVKVMGRKAFRIPERTSTFLQLDEQKHINRNSMSISRTKI